MGRRITLMLTALLAIATLLFIVIYMSGLQPASETEPLPDFTVMDKAELSALILVNPNWREPRARLTFLLLEEGNTVTALQHMLVLSWANWDTADLETELINTVTDNPAEADACLSLLADQRVNWLWPKELSVEIATLSNQVDYILDNLPALLESNSQHPLATAALTKYTNTDILTAWEIGHLMGHDYLGQVVYTILRLPAEEKTTVIGEIIEKYPQQPLALVLGASLLGGNDGLEALLALEAGGLKPWEPWQYSEVKLSLLLEALPQEISAEHVLNLDFAGVIARANPLHSLSEPEQSWILDLFLTMEGLGLEPPDQNQYSFSKYPLLQAVVPREAHQRTVTDSYFDHLLPEHLFYIIEDWTEKLHWAGYDEHSLMEDIKSAAGRLSQDPEWAHIQSIVTPPGPPSALAVLAAENRRDQGQISQVSLSPDASQLVYFTANTIWWYDLQDQQYRLAQSIPPGEVVNVYWPPDSRSFVLEFQNPESGNRVQLYSTSQSGIPVETEIQQATVLGWQDNTTLLLSLESPAGYIVSSLEPRTGVTQTLTTLPRQPILTPTGKTAWAEVSGTTLNISIQGSLSSYNLPEEGLVTAGWLPGDRGILLRSKPGDYLLVDFATGKITELNIKGHFTPYASGWSSENKIPGSFALGLVNHIMILDLEDNSLIHTGIVSYFGALSGSSHYWHIYSGSIYIYNIQ